MNVSVVMAVRDGERYLAEALASVDAQTVAPLEVLLVDGGSRDATRAIAEGHGARVLEQEGDTLADAFNTGIRAARGDAIAFLSHDDVWLPRKLELWGLWDRTLLMVCAGVWAAGLHVLRVAERTYAGVRPYDEKVQAEVKRKLQNQIYEREVRRLLDTLWKRTQPQIWVEG